MAAPWETTDAAPTAPVAAPAASASVAPWETAPALAPSMFSGQYWSDYGNRVADAAKKVWNTPSTLKTDLQTVGAVGSSLVAPLVAVARTMPHTDNEGGSEVPDYKPPVSYTQAKADATYMPTDLASQAKLNLIGSVTKPIGDVFHHVAGVFTDDPEVKDEISDALSYALPVAGKAASFARATARLGAEAPALATHPAVVAANDLADAYNIKLTRGQQVAQAATDLPAESTDTARALNVPYQLEAKTATQTGAAGKAYANHFATQQNTLAGHIQELADDVRAAGDEATASRIENAIVEKSPGVNTVNGRALQRVVDKDYLGDTDLSGRLDELNDLSGLIDPPAKGPIIDGPLVGVLKDKLANAPTAIGGLAGGAVGLKVGHALGHPFIGAELGTSAGGYLGSKLSGVFESAPGDITTITTADLKSMAKRAGISPEEMAQQLARTPKAAPPVATPTPVATAPAPAPIAAPAPVRAVPAGAAGKPGYELHKYLMDNDPDYRKARLLAAGIIE